MKNLNYLQSKVPAHLTGLWSRVVPTLGGLPLVSGIRLFRATNAVNQTRKDLLNQIDWEKHSGKLYVIVDPMDPEGILYLTEKEYLRERRVAISNDISLDVLARPGSKRPAPEGTTESSVLSNNSPLLFRRLSSWMVNKAHLGSVRSLFPNFSEEGMVSLSRGNTGQLFLRWGLTLLYWAGYPVTRARCYKLIAVSTRVSRLREQFGSRGVVRILKASLVVVLQYLAGTPCNDPRALGWPLGLRHGLPRWLPVTLRAEIRKKNVVWIRIIVSILNAYKAIKCHGTMDLATIQAEPMDTESCNELLQEFKSFCDNKFWESVPYVPMFDGQKYCKLALTTKAGPNHPLSFLDSQLSLVAYSQDLRKREQLLGLAEAQGMGKWMRFYIERWALPTALGWTQTKPLTLGKLATKEEAAGKVRVFAIVDYWTQRLSAPWHDLFFNILKGMSEVDGTFDQDKLVETMAKRQWESAFSYDLKSATDMIPLELYKVLFSSRYPLANQWLDFIVDRSFRVPITKSNSKEFYMDSEGILRWDDHLMVRYTRGQPMGCLGSWASLALVHHALVRFAMFRVGRNIKDQTYGVLGDDVVIFDSEVASQYLSITRAFGIPIGLPKSFVSEGPGTRGSDWSAIESELADPGIRFADLEFEPVQVDVPGALFNFANQTFMGGVCLSVMSLKEELGVTNPFQRIMLAKRLIRRGWTDGSFSRHVRLIFTRSGWRAATPQMSRGQIPRSMRILLRFALNPEIDYFRIDRAAKLWLWSVVSRPSFPILSAAAKLVDGEENGAEKVGWSKLEGWNLISTLKKDDRRTFARAIYAYLWTIRDSLLEVRKLKDKEYDAMHDCLDLMPKWCKGVFFQVRSNYRPTPEDDAALASLDEYLPKLDGYLQNYVPTVKTPYLWMLYMAGNALMVTGSKILNDLGQPMPFSRVLEFLEHWRERGKSPSDVHLKANLCPARVSRAMDFRSRAILKLFRDWNQQMEEIGGFPHLRRDKQPTSLRRGGARGKPGSFLK